MQAQSESRNVTASSHVITVSGSSDRLSRVLLHAGDIARLTTQASVCPSPNVDTHRQWLIKSTPLTCIARKVPELCVPYNPTANNTSSSGPDPDTAHRIERLETVLSYVVRHHGGLWGYKDIKEWMHGMSISRPARFGY